MTPSREDEVEVLRLGVSAHLLDERALQTRHLLVAARVEVVLELTACARSKSRAPSRRSFSARARCSSVMVAPSFCSLSSLAFSACCCACRVRSRGANSAAHRLHHGLRLRRLLGKPLKVDDPDLQLGRHGGQRRQRADSHQPDPHLLLDRKIHGTTYPRIKTLRCGRESRRPKRLVSRRMRDPGGSILLERLADRELEALGLVSPGGRRHCRAWR